MTHPEGLRNPPEPDPSGGQTRVSGRLILAILVSAVVVLSSPVVGDIRDAIRRAAGANYGLVISAIVLGAVAILAAGALWRIRDRRLVRYGAILTALAAGAAYVRVNALPGVEQFHFVEYGLVTFLFYRAIAPRTSHETTSRRSDPSVVVVPIIAALIVGTADEWVQWFVPRRYGEVRDIYLNSAAIACGLLFSIGVAPPAGWRFRPTPRSLRIMTALAATAVLALAAFVYSVHVGTLVADGEIGAFRSRHSAPALMALSADRLVRWSPGGPPPERTLAREDQYLTEGIWHVQARNEAWAHRDFDTAWRENLILEKYFAPVLRAGHAWPPVQRADAASRQLPPGPGGFVSRAERYPIVTWSRAWFAGGVFTAIFCLLAINFTSSLASPKRPREGGRWC